MLKIHIPPRPAPRIPAATKQRLYIAPLRGRLPRRRLIGTPDPQSVQKWRWMAFWCLLSAAFWGSVGWWASR